MTGEFLGELPPSDPLFGFLADEVLNRALGISICGPAFDVYRLDGNSAVFRYVERRSSVDIVGKFYGRKRLLDNDDDFELHAQLMHREFDNLKRLRELGFDSYPHYVVRPLAASESIDCVLVEEFAAGAGLTSYIREAVESEKSDELRARVADIGSLFANLHNRLILNEAVSDATPLAYLGRVTGHLYDKQVISSEQLHQFQRLSDRWGKTQLLNITQQVVIHGDATASNFLCSGEHNVTIIDLERLGMGDRAIDIGYMAGDLKHLLWLCSHNKLAGDLYVEHFCTSYFNRVSATGEAQDSLMERVRFYIACSELRIARNEWIDLKHRLGLVQDALGYLEI